VARHTFHACPVWIYTQSNITQASYSPEYITRTQEIYLLSCPGNDLSRVASPVHLICFRNLYRNYCQWTYHTYVLNID
jgi:hypothetical protein